MLISTLVLSLLAPLSFASSNSQKSCLTLLEKPAAEDNQSFEPDAVEISKASEWLSNQGSVKTDEATSRAIIAQWEKWTNVSKAARKATLGIELQMLSNPSTDNVFAWDNSEKLKQLSSANLQRMIRTLTERHPEATKLLQNLSLSEKARKMSQQLHIHYVRDPDVRSNAGVHPPLASSRELAKLKLGFQTQSFYSQLIGSPSPSVEFNVLVSNGNATAADVVRLRDDYAAQEGFVVPGFQNIEELLKFFELWDPAALERLYKMNRMSLPKAVNSGVELMDFLESGAGAVEEIFPATAPERLSALRTKLSEYILTESDAQEFLRTSFQLYFLSEAGKTTSQYPATSVLTIFKRNFLPFIGWASVSLHVPVSVPANAYSIYRYEGYRPPTLADRFSRRLDHNSKP